MARKPAPTCRLSYLQGQNDAPYVDTTDDVQIISDEVTELKKYVGTVFQTGEPFPGESSHQTGNNLPFYVMLPQTKGFENMGMCGIMSISPETVSSVPFWNRVINEENKTFKKRITEMFPDVDLAFLNSKSKDFSSEEDCNRFINTVMLSGMYPKRSQEKEGEVIDFFSGGPIVWGSTEFLDHLYERPTASGSGNREIWNEEEFIDFLQSGFRSTRLMDEDGNSVEDDDDDGGDTHSSVDEDNDSPDLISLEDEGKVDLIGTSLEYDWSSEASCTDMYNGELGKCVSPQQSISGNVDASRASTSGHRQMSDLVSTPLNVGEDTFQEDDVTYNTSEEWLAEKTTELIRLFPKTDPSFLRAECVKFNGSLERMNEFVIMKLEKNDMPSKQEYEKRLELEELQHRYTTNFNIEDFLQVIPDPWTYFADRKRDCTKYLSHSQAYLKTKFRKLLNHVIYATLVKNKYNLYLTYKELEKKKKKKGTTRVNARCDYECSAQRPTTMNIQFLQEVAFIENEKEIKKFIREKEASRRLKFDEAKKSGNLFECQCCFDQEIMAEDTVLCPNGHCVCKSCMVKFVQLGISQAKCQFPCLTDCGEDYTLAALQSALRPELFSKVLQTSQMEEIKAAGIEDLVQCPFCNYATIMPPEVKIMTCLNPECLKESCRLCKELSHIPLRCDEVEKSEEVKMRTYIENKMTEALIRRCYKCGKGFVKEEGCNKIVCSCGAKMCYICRKPVQDYSHFNGQGGTQYEKCPLYSTNDELHVDVVKQVAEKAKEEVLKANPNTTLKVDPTLILPRRTDLKPLPGMNVRANNMVAGRLFPNVPLGRRRGW